MIIRSIQLRVISVGVGGFFMYAGINKLLYSANDTLYGALLPSPWLQAAVAFAEVAMGIWLCVRPRDRAPLRLALVTVLFFSGIVGAELLRDDPKPCGCTGPPNAITSTSDIRFDLAITLTRNILFVVALASTIATTRATRNVEGSYVHEIAA